MSEVTLERQLKCVAREIAMRRNVFRKRIARGDMRQDEAGEEIAAMEAVYATLQDVARLGAALVQSQADLAEAKRLGSALLDAMHERAIFAEAELDKLRGRARVANVSST